MIYNTLKNAKIALNALNKTTHPILQQTKNDKEKLAKQRIDYLMQYAKAIIDAHNKKIKKAYDTQAYAADLTKALQKIYKELFEST